MLTQYFVHRRQYRLLAWCRFEDRHFQRFVIQRNDKTRTAHAAQLIEHQRPIGHRQRAKVTDAGRHRIRQTAGAGDQPFHLRGAQLR
jgi:hypothetical protein